ncbi:MAG: AAA family ATPase [Chlorobiaceae bacterium]
MSIAGIRSNRGDYYQTLVAFDWAITILSDPDFLWIEIDSTAYPVDDIVVGKTDGTQICCQCKKNQPDFKAWSISDLTDEIAKAAKLLYKNKKAIIYFYSRTPFGALDKLREHSTTQSDEVAYRQSLGKELQKKDSDLALQLAEAEVPLISTYDFLNKIRFEVTKDFDRMKGLLHERLRSMVSNHEIAYDALWTRLDQLGARMMSCATKQAASSLHRLTKDDLKAILHQSGVVLAPIMDLAEIRKSFAGTSAIGRNWKRDIAGHRITNSVLNELLTAIETKNRSILLTGLPGSGKTCVMLELQEKLEQKAQNNSDIVPLFIQSRDFAHLSTVQEREASGLPEKWVEQAARMAEEAHVVVVIDSLDVLSIAREHTVLSYFLAQIDRLLTIPNITMVTSCRNFDRRYDRQIAERQWDYEAKCLPLDWESQIAPLLNTLGINSAAIDADTRELIRNPRELALFVELAQQEGTFRVVTGQELARRYLDSFVVNNSSLGETAIHAIESIANEMLYSRKLAVSKQRLNTTQDIQRSLYSLNILQENMRGELMFGHQTLLDTLVISSALRRNDTLYKFIQDLPPVPFVRPSIRSFTTYLASGERLNYRKQLRTVFSSSTAFHIRRLVAETFAEQTPQDEDWPLIRDLKKQNKGIFQAIYAQAKQIEWHHFWLKHLIPLLIEEQDAEGLLIHTHHISQWKNDDTDGVVAFWMQVLQLDWMDKKQLAMRLPLHLSKIDTEKMSLAAHLLRQLLNLPKQEDGFLGHAVARCVLAGSLEDIWLWNYIAGDINDENVTKFTFDNKLHCEPHEFGNGNEDFLRKRMIQSTTLLDLALESIEKWSQCISSSYCQSINKGHSDNFLFKTSYHDLHSQHEQEQHKNSVNILFNAIEAAILNQAQINSEWWLTNRERLGFSHEGALRYFAILACSSNPEMNIDCIGQILKDNEMLESDLSFELGTLMQKAFIYLDSPTQAAVQECILTLWENKLKDERFLKSRCQLIVSIPTYLRSIAARAVLDDFEKANGTLTRKPDIQSGSGWVSPPFSYEVFHRITDSGVLRLLEHYSGYQRHSYDGDHLVSSQLREASSRHPIRFLQLLAAHWSHVSEEFRNAIMEGAAEYLARLCGNVIFNDNWKPLDKPDASFLAIKILDELEKHRKHWYHNHAASKAIQSCAHIIKDTQNGMRLVFLTIGFENFHEESSIQKDQVDLINKGINMISGHIAEALMILANRFQENNVSFPELLEPTLHRFAGKEHPAIRAVILNHLPYLQSQNPKLGWDLFNLAMQDSSGLWKIAESCLYYAYHNHFEKVAPILSRIHKEGSGKDMETWGRISALASLSEHVDFSVLLNELKALDSPEAWKGAASVWTNHENITRHKSECLNGMETGLNTKATHAVLVAETMRHLFYDNNSILSIPIKLIKQCFTVFENDSQNKHSFFEFPKWLNVTAHHDPEQALALAEIYIPYVSRTKAYIYNHENNLTQFMTRLFAEAEEREESDNSTMLHRVVSLQNILLALEVDGVNDWLKAAERP